MLALRRCSSGVSLVIVPLESRAEASLRRTEARAASLGDCMRIPLERTGLVFVPAFMCATTMSETKIAAKVFLITVTPTRPMLLRLFRSLIGLLRSGGALQRHCSILFRRVQ